MNIPNRPARLNRALLCAAGLILLAAGTCEVASRFGIIHVLPRHQALSFLPGSPPRWAAYLALAIAIAAGLAAVRWLAAQFGRSPRTVSWRLTADPDRGTTTMRTEAATAPLTADIETYDGVRTAAAWLTGPRAGPALYLQVRTEYDADLAALRRRIHEHALPRLRSALELDDLPAVLLIAPTGTRARTR